MRILILDKLEHIPVLSSNKKLVFNRKTQTFKIVFGIILIKSIECFGIKYHTFLCYLFVKKYISHH